MLNRLISILSLSVGFPLFLWVAWLIWQNDLILSDEISRNELIASSAELERTAPLVTEPLRVTLLSASMSVDVDAHLMVSIAKEYVLRKPFDAQGWLLLSQFYSNIGSAAASRESLAIAHNLSKNNTTALMRVFNRYLELGLLEQSLPVAHDLALARPSSFRRIFYLMARLSSDYDVVVETMVPNTVSADGNHDEAWFFYWAIYDSIRAKNRELANAVWRAMPRELKKGSEMGVRYLAYIAEFQDPMEFKPVWRNVTGADLIAEEFPLSRFDDMSSLEDVSPCWQSGENEGVSWRLDERAYSGSGSLMVEFFGKENVYFSDLSCFLLVTPNVNYTLSARWAGDGLTTLAGPYIGVYAPGLETRDFYPHSDQQTGTWPWQLLQVEFTPPEDVSIVRVRIRRDKTNFLDSKISGKVWFDDFKLSRTSELSQSVSQKVVR